MNTSLNDWANAYKPSTLCWRTTMKRSINIRFNKHVHTPINVHNTSYDNTKNCYDNDAGNVGANRFGYLSLEETHERRDQNDWDNDINELDFN